MTLTPGLFPQGTFSYPGITGVLQASMTMTNGINPSVMQVLIPARVPGFDPEIPRVGTAVWEYASSSGVLFRREFPRCTISSNRITTQDGSLVWDMSILDRRWLWQFGQISGEYNIRVGNNVIPKRKKNARQLATMAFQAMGEQSYSVDAIPDDDYPYVNWIVTNPAKALADLCDLYNCEIAYQSFPDGELMRVVKKNFGETVPQGWLEFEETYDPAELPRYLAVVTSPVEWQVDLPIEENVGWDSIEKTFKQVDFLPYTPEDGWDDYTEIRDFDKKDIIDETDREMAYNHVWRTYRIGLGDYETLDPDDPELDPPASGADAPEEAGGDPIKVPTGADLPLPYAVFPLTSPDQLVPILDHLTQPMIDGVEEEVKRSCVYGSFIDGSGIETNTANRDDDGVALDFEGPKDYDPSLIYRGSFTLDQEAARITFSEPFFMEEDRRPKPPKAYLRCSVNLRDLATGQVQRWIRYRLVDPTSPGGTMYVHRDDIVPQLAKASATSPNWINNIPEVEQACDHYLDQLVESMKPKVGISATYEGFVVVNNDGAIRQVTYTIDGEGTATTSVARNFEDASRAVTWDEARAKQKLNDLLGQKDREKLLMPEKRDRHWRRKEPQVFNSGGFF